MQVKPSLEQMKLNADGYGVMPLTAEIYADIRTPIEVLKTLRELSGKCFLLESVEGGGHWSRYSFLGFDPIAEVRLKNGEMTIESGVTTTLRCTDPNAELRSILAGYKSPGTPLSPFSGGFAGYFGYDYCKYFTPLETTPDEEGALDLHLMLFDKVIAFDNFRQRMIFIANVRTDDLEANYRRAANELKNLIGLVVGSRYVPAGPSRLTTPVTARFTEAEYCERVEAVKARIREGDIFQAVISNCRSAGFSGSLLGPYRYLRTTNPSPYMFYLSLGETELAGASPETLVKKQGGAVTTFPIAGTRPRGATTTEDEQTAIALLSDPKELAEHDMLVDLGRNDLGKICRFGTVRVSEYRRIRRFSHVMHITSTVTGELCEDKDALDAIAAALPAGTLSGAPKLAACRIIDRIEGSGRGVYGGAVGYIDFAGNADVCIAIRMAVLTGGRVYVRSGGGIVADSVPEAEYRESADKAQAVVDALMFAEEEVS